MRTNKVTRGSHYDADAKMAVPEPCYKHLIPCERCHKLSVNHF